MKKINELFDVIKNDTLKNCENIWVGSPFEFLQDLSSDEIGRWGENVAYSLINELTNYKVVWDKDKNIKNRDGSIYDIFVNLYRLETKTATKGTKSDKWQHENLYEENVWDKIIFIDVNLFGIYFTIMNHADIPFGDSKHLLLNKKSTRHLSGWKFDLTLNQIKKLENNGDTFYYDWNNPNEEGLKKFLTIKLS